jgi:hypothetical protein
MRYGVPGSSHADALGDHREIRTPQNSTGLVESVVDNGSLGGGGTRLL